MRDFNEFNGPMKDWPRVQAVPGAAETLAVLRPHWTLALATNANDSTEADIRAALRRVDLDDDLKLPPCLICMVGDNYEADVMGANACGMRAIWFNEHSLKVRENDLQRTIHELRALPDCLKLMHFP